MKDINRKNFLRVMGASLAMTQLNCVKKPVEKIVPFLMKNSEDSPENNPGQSVYYATAYVKHEICHPMLIKVKDGRPIKIENLTSHPVTEGALSSHEIAMIWDLYDPDRIRTSLLKKVDNKFINSPWDVSIAQVKKVLDDAKNSKKKVAYLSRPTISPSELKIRNTFLKYYNIDSYLYDNFGDKQELLEGSIQSFNLSSETCLQKYHRFDKARLILAVESDFLGSHSQSALYTKQFSKNRNSDDKNSKMSRLICVESNFTLTGANADERIALRSGTQVSLLLGLANLLLVDSKYKNDIILKNKLAKFNLIEVSKVTNIHQEKIIQIAEELKQYRNEAIVVSSGSNEKSGYLQTCVNFLNDILSNSYTSKITEYYWHKELNQNNHYTQLNKLLDFFQNINKYDTIIVDRVNPIFELPLELQKILISNFSKMNVISICERVDETSSLSDIILPVSHSFESWSDAYLNNTYTIAQPVIKSLFETKSIIDIFIQLLPKSFIDKKKKFSNDYEYIIDFAILKNLIDRNKTKKKIKDLLSIGWLLLYQKQKLNLAFNKNSILTVLSNVIIKSSNNETKQKYFLTLYESMQLRDGSLANNSYRHEVSDPISKISWDNYLIVSEADAIKNKWENGTIVVVKNTQYNLKVPVYIQPGVMKKNISLAIGYGHSYGNVSRSVGCNASRFISFLFEKNNSICKHISGIEVSIETTSEKYEFAFTQKEHGLEKDNLFQDRQRKIKEQIQYDFLSRSIVPAIYEVNSKTTYSSLYPEHKYDTYRWGMNIDLSKCTGCQSCVTACYSENNIPVVGKEEVTLGREMSWIRIDRYYVENKEHSIVQGIRREMKKDVEVDVVEQSPTTLFQPIMCQHCENAPCENVCPVGATSHSDEGLNDMSYNRCVGTRYCENNCPYKVRRFNFYENWIDKTLSPKHLAINPDVTVRSRGVIEKCTFCVQRINEKRIEAKLEGRRIREDDLKTACQIACPADAIVFGDINDYANYKKNNTGKEINKINRANQSIRNFKVLEHLNIKPMVTYKKKIINS